eukprot:m.51542 g.51542  ORF g.51542 m.51542 type:complete len:55 (+) comp16444_c0_seq1:75-239(+)
MTNFPLSTGVCSASVVWFIDCDELLIPIANDELMVYCSLFTEPQELINCRTDAM